MSETPETTAKIFNSLILNFDQMINAKDFYLALQEFAIGQPTSTRATDLCWGFANSKPDRYNLASFLSSPTLNEIEGVIGQGICRVSNLSVTKKLTEVSTSFVPVYITSALLDISENKYKDTYAFADIFLTQNGTDLESGLPLVQVDVEILTGEIGGDPLLMTKDLDLNTVIDMIYSNEIPTAAKPQENSIAIYSVLMDIHYLDPNNEGLKNVDLYFIDKRLPRGWGGFADEDMSIYLSSYLTSKYLDYSNLLESIESNIYNVIRSWINMRTWAPNFIDFWNDPENSQKMPDRLKSYLNKKFSIIIS
jgi:hypothetical protein